MEEIVCYLKPEFLVEKKDKAEDVEPKIEEKDNLEPPNKKQRKSKNKDRGQNKNRPVFRENVDNRLCHSLIKNEKCGKEGCKFSHDLENYIKGKSDDINETCYIYSTKGFCPYGITCRFAKNHLDENFGNLNPDNIVLDDSRHLSFELQSVLRKKKYDFSKSDKIMKEVDRILKKKNDSEKEESEKPLGSVSDEDLIKTRPAETKKVSFRDKILLSPLTTVGNLPFRRICKEYGVDITCGEMACAIPIVNGHLQEWALTKRHESEDVFGVQLCSHSAKLLTYVTQVLNENIQVDFFDLNMGCPIDLIYNQGGGSALMRRPYVLETIVRSCSTLLDDKPFTVKMRTGIYSNKSVAHELLPKIEEWGASAVTLHGRSKEQRYTKNADWKYVQKCAEKMKNIPVIGNGDILSFEDYLNVKEVAPKVSSVMIGRGALIKPWIFKEMKEQKAYDISSQERLDLLKKYVNYGLEHWGSDTKGVENTRRFLLEWLSFFYRYVPYGILAKPPQKINQRPQCESYLGRDDLETLLASPKSSDWIKISEMLLGKVPEGFTFLPKHKANAYQG